MSLPQNIIFNHPEWLVLLGVIPFIYILLRYRGHPIKSSAMIDGLSGATIRVRHPLFALLSNKSSTQTSQNSFKTLLYMLILGLLVIALAEPVKLGQQLPDPPRQRDIVFIVDTSVSMVLKDYILDGQRVDRMNVIRSTLNQFIQQLKGDKVSIIAFADTAHVLVPLTDDTDLILAMLKRLRTGLAGRASAPGDAIALAVKNIIKHNDRHQIMVLVTDAALPVGTITPTAAANIAASRGIPLYTIAVGADTYSAEETRTTGLVYHPADRQLLAEMATTTGAKSYLAGNSRSLQQAIADIERQQRNEQKLVPRYYHQPLYHWPLLSALILLSLFQLRAITGKTK